MHTDSDRAVRGDAGPLGARRTALWRDLRTRCSPLRAHLIAGLLALGAFAAMADVEVNQGSVADLDAIKGIGPALSGRIVEARKQGDFKDWADLIARVPGIREAAAARLSAAGLTVNGRPYEPPAAKK